MNLSFWPSLSVMLLLGLSLEEPFEVDLEEAELELLLEEGLL